MKTCLVTGAAGFIGSNFCRALLADPHSTPNDDVLVLAVDKADEEQFLLNLNPADLVIQDVDEKGFRDYPEERIRRFPLTPIGDHKAIVGILRKYEPDWVVNFAAESHVDRSIDGPREFWENNVMQLESFLQVCIDYGKLEKFVHISTDEIYGDRDNMPWATEKDAMRPSSPYAASKVAQEAMVMAYGRTYGLPWVITRCSNNYGPRQAPEKMIPLMVSKIIANQPLPVYGDGKQRRDWIHVDDHCEAILFLLETPTPTKGAIFNIGRGIVRDNLYVVEKIMEFASHYRKDVQIEHVEDRPGHDRCYAINTQKLLNRGWCPKVMFDSGLKRTVEWYIDNPKWVEKMIELGYSTARVGTGT